MGWFLLLFLIILGYAITENNKIANKKKRGKVKPPRNEIEVRAVFEEGYKDEFSERDKQRSDRDKERVKGVDVVYLDIETTGLDYTKDEVLEVAIIDDNGEVLLNTLVRPEKRKRWTKAKEIHGISFQMVKDAPTLEEIKPLIIDAVRGKRVVIYNKQFDTRFIPFVRNVAFTVSCCMLRYADYKKIGYYAGQYRWHKLIDATKDIGYESTEASHRALADARACRAVWRWLDKKIGTYRSSIY